MLIYRALYKQINFKNLGWGQILEFKTKNEYKAKITVNVKKLEGGGCDLNLKTTYKSHPIYLLFKFKILRNYYLLC